MAVTLGIDMGSNSVATAWVDTKRPGAIRCGVTIFPAGVEESERKRGAPKGRARRLKAAQRRQTFRRSMRKKLLKRILIAAGLLPEDATQRRDLFASTPDPWFLRRKGLTEELTPYEFGRVLVHISQRRGALGVEVDADDPEAGKVKSAMERCEKLRNERDAKTVGKLVADLMEERKVPMSGKFGATYSQPVRNRQYRIAESDQLHAPRDLLHAEFKELWKKQREYANSELANLLTDDLLHALDDTNPPSRRTAIGKWRFCGNYRTAVDAEAAATVQKEEKGRNTRVIKGTRRGANATSPRCDVFRLEAFFTQAPPKLRHGGALFGQRSTYWRLSTLGRCDLEPTDRNCPAADMHAQEFRVLETVNNIYIEPNGAEAVRLSECQRAKVIKLLQREENVTPARLRKELGLGKKSAKALYSLNVERKGECPINVDWFHRTIVAAIGVERWNAMTPKDKESVNRAVLKFDPGRQDDAERLRDGATRWWGLTRESADELVEAWKTRPPLEKRINLSRRALLNLLPYMREAPWLTLTEARGKFATDAASGATAAQRARYSVNSAPNRRSARRYLKKHRNSLPPAPMLANPVARRAIHELRRQIIAYIREFGRLPDRVVIELARSATQSAKVRNNILEENNKRAAEKRTIINEFELAGLPQREQDRAIERILLWMEQGEICPYSGLERGADGDALVTISRAAVRDGIGVEIDHIIPESRSQERGFANKLLCLREANRGKGNKTPQEWLSADAFERLKNRLRHLQKASPAKWRNINRDAPKTPEEFADSQLHATAYAAREVAAYLQGALFASKRDGGRYVYTTKGSYTAMLRRDWGLNGLLQEINSSTASGTNGEHNGEKTRTDHRHHAVDAVVIALTDPAILAKAARNAYTLAEEREVTGRWGRRRAIDAPSPWRTAEGLREEVRRAVEPLVVSHRPIKRKLVGALHNEDIWAAVDKAAALDSDDDVRKKEYVFKKRYAITKLTPKMLRRPIDESPAQIKARLARLFERKGATPHQAKKWAEQRFRQGQFHPCKVDPPLEKGGLVRNWRLRKIIRECVEKRLKDLGLQLDKVTPKRFEDILKDLARCGELADPKSGVPIKSAIVIARKSGMVRIAVKDGELGGQAQRVRTSARRAKREPPAPAEARAGVPLFRFHESQSNHHVEILKEIHDSDEPGEWRAELVRTFDAVRRARPKKGVAKRPIVDRSDRDGCQFVMSIAEGETLHMRHKLTGELGYFVLAKIDRRKSPVMHFVPHWDARPARPTRTTPKREEFTCTAGELRTLGEDEHKPPRKVRVSPLGKITELRGD